METNDKLIAIWNELTSFQKMAFGEKWITHETNLCAWDKPFSELSPLKRDRILLNVNILPKKPSQKVSVIGSGIKTNTLEINVFKNGIRI